VPPESTDAPKVLSNLAGSLLERYNFTHQLADLNRAIEASESAIKLIRDESPLKTFALGNWGTSLHARYEQSGDLADLSRAIDALKPAARLSSGHVPQTIFMYSLAASLLDRHAVAGDPSDLREATAAYESVCRSGLDFVVLRARKRFAQWALAKKDWPEANEALTHVLEIRDRLLAKQRGRAGREAWLWQGRNLHAWSAYALARMNQPKRAAEVLEMGRARLLADVISGSEASLGELKGVPPETLARFVAASNRLRALEAHELEKPADSPAGAALSEALLHARSELRVVVDEIRQVSEHEDFLAPLTFSNINEAATANPLVYLAVTPAGAMALIVRGECFESSLDAASEKEPAVLWFDDLTEDALFQKMVGPEYLGGYLGVLDRWRDAPRHPAGISAWFAALDEMTRWLWDVLMAKLGEALLNRDIRAALLIPQGALSLLPLHAAWTEAGVTGERRYAMDDVCYSYVPNARVVTRAQAFRNAPSDSALVVEQPLPVSAAALPNAALEVAEVCKHFSAETSTLLRHEEATKEAVCRRVLDYAVLHFSGHGSADFGDPLDGGLLLAGNERLSLRDLFRFRFERPRLAVLSACETGISGTRVPDEVFSLSAGMLQAGFPGVVSSLWSVADESTRVLMTEFYDLWKRVGLSPPEALRRAQQRVRDDSNHKHFAHPFYWAAFHYTGI
jgi:hypothetical protein